MAEVDAKMTIELSILIYPCVCEVSTHGAVAQVVCHGLGINKTSGRPYALVEYTDGEIRVLYLDEYNHLRKL